MHPEAESLFVDDHLRVQQVPDMAQFEAEFAQQEEAGHVHSAACEHHHADAFIDHPEDHTHESVVHEAAHDREGHVHSPSCGHVEHDQAHEHVDHHVHSESCGHLHHGEAKEHIDHGHEDDHREHNHHNTEHDHVHHSGCGHVGYEHAEGNIDKHHIHDANCGHLHHHESTAHVDHVEKPKRETHDHEHNTTRAHIHQVGCGHVGFECAHEQADHGEHHDHQHIPEMLSETETVARNRAHDVEIINAKRHEEQVSQQRIDLHAIVAHEQAVRITEAERQTVVSQHIELVAPPEVVETIVPVREERRQQQLVEEMGTLGSGVIDQDKQAITPPANEPLVAMQSETATPVTPDAVRAVDPEPLGSLVEVNTMQEADKVDVLDDAFELYIPLAVSQEAIVNVPDVSAMESGVATELAAEDLIETETTESPELIVDIGVPHVIQESIFIEPGSAEQILSSEQSEVTTESSSIEVQAEVETELPLLSAIEEQFKVLDEIAVRDRSEVMDELRKSIANLNAMLHDHAIEKVTAKISQEMIHLLTILGFEKPRETLDVYLQKYGLSIWDELLARLFELLRQSRSMEAITPSFSFLNIPTTTTRSTQNVGRIVLALLAKLQRSKGGLRELTLAA